MTDFGGAVTSTRRYYLLKLNQRRGCGTDSFWRKQQQAQPGTALPTDFPALSELAALDYTTVEDLKGATEEELTCVGLKPHAAKAVIAAFEKL